MVGGVPLLVAKVLSFSWMLVDPPMTRAPGFERSLDESSLGDEASVSKGRRVGFSVMGVEVDAPADNKGGVIVHVEGTTLAPCLVLLCLGGVLRLEGDGGMMRAFTSGVDASSGFNTMSATSAARPSWCLHSSTGK